MNRHAWKERLLVNSVRIHSFLYHCRQKVDLEATRSLESCCCAISAEVLQWASCRCISGCLSGNGCSLSTYLLHWHGHSCLIPYLWRLTEHNCSVTLNITIQLRVLLNNVNFYCSWPTYTKFIWTGHTILALLWIHIGLWNRFMERTTERYTFVRHHII